jgi:hypothetical protein
LNSLELLTVLAIVHHVREFEISASEYLLGFQAFSESADRLASIVVFSVDGTRNTGVVQFTVILKAWVDYIDVWMPLVMQVNWAIKSDVFATT